MDLFQAAKYFDLQRFENYDFTTNAWAGTYFEGQLKKSDTFQTIYHRPTRKRMLYCVPGQTPASTVVRVETTGEQFIVGALQEDSHQNTHYRNVYALHKPRGIATITRLAPTGPSNDPGWAIQTTVETMFVDLEMRSVNENEDDTLTHRGHFFATLPFNSLLQRSDLITLDGEPYYVLERYIDSNMVAARVAQHRDPRENFVYWRHGPDGYSGGVVTPGGTNYNVSGRVGETTVGEVSGDIAATAIKVIIPTAWIGFEPGIDDKITVAGREYRIRRIIRDVLEDEWNLVVDY